MVGGGGAALAWCGLLGVPIVRLDFSFSWYFLIYFPA